MGRGRPSAGPGGPRLGRVGPSGGPFLVGDELVSSGLGKRFPSGYPVALVTKVNRDEGMEFAEIIARPTASFDRINHLLLVSNQNFNLDTD